jgi:Holliday junction resolvasome RuvABC ATP-dependent DNA helicase subunit
MKSFIILIILTILIGLKAIKQKAIDVALKVLLTPPADIKNETSCNFLFLGNTGTGKTTVATLLAEALGELGFRQNSTPVLISAGDLLAAKDPLSEFMDRVDEAEEGTLFIDEVGLFDPAPRGSKVSDNTTTIYTNSNNYYVIGKRF